MVLATLAIAALLPPFGLLGSAGCFGACTSAGCGSGFELTIAAPEPPAPMPGEPFQQTRFISAVYRVEAQVDGGTFEVECTFDDEGEGTCEEGTWVSPPARELFGHTSLVRADLLGELWGWGMSVRFHGSSPARWGDNYYGPDNVAVTVFRDGAEAASASYEPEYEVLEDFNGEGCGDCEVTSPQRLYVEPST